MNNEALQRASGLEDTGLATRSEFGIETAPTAAAAEKQYEIQGAIVLAKRFPRDEDGAFQKLMKACNRTTFAEDAEYSFPRGGQKISGPSVNLAREAARIWTNIRYGVSITVDDENVRQIQGWAWDLETNTKIAADDSFKKLVQRRQKNGETTWIAPDERDLRELTNRRAAIVIRNCILQILPKDLIEDAVTTCRQTLRLDADKDPDSARKKILTAFSELNVTAEMLASYLGHPLSQSSPSEIADLRGVYKSISDGNTTWGDYINQTPEMKAEELKDKTKANAAKLREKVAPKEAEKPDFVEPDILERPDEDVSDFVEADESDPEPIDTKKSKRADYLSAIEEADPERVAIILDGRELSKLTDSQIKDIYLEVTK